MCFTHLRRFSADNATTFRWVSSILLLSPIINLLLTPGRGQFNPVDKTGRLWAVCYAGVDYPTRVPSSLRPPAQPEVLRGAITVWEEGPKERVEFTGAGIGIIGRTLN